MFDSFPIPLATLSVRLSKLSTFDQRLGQQNQHGPTPRGLQAKTKVAMVKWEAYLSAINIFHMTWQ